MWIPVKLSSMLFLALITNKKKRQLILSTQQKKNADSLLSEMRLHKKNEISACSQHLFIP